MAEVEGGLLAPETTTLLFGRPGVARSSELPPLDPFRAYTRPHTSTESQWPWHGTSSRLGSYEVTALIGKGGCVTRLYGARKGRQPGAGQYTDTFAALNRMRARISRPAMHPLEEEVVD